MSVPLAVCRPLLFVARWPRARLLAVLLAVLAGVSAPPGARPAVASVPPVVFRLEDPAARPLAEACAALWREHGAALAAAILPAGVVPDTVHCLILPSERFDAYFADRLPDWGVGVALPPGRLIALDHQRIRAVGPGPQAVFFHEMAHALLFQAAGEVRLPTWLHEGVAMRASGEWRVTDTLGVILEGRVPSLASISGPFPRGAAAAQRAYRTSLLAVNWLEAEHGPGAVQRILAAVRQHGDWPTGFRAATGEEAQVFASRFHGAMRLRYGWVLMIFRWPTLFVIMALVFLTGAVVKVVRNRRALAREAAAEERAHGSGPDHGDAGWPGRLPPDGED